MSKLILDEGLDMPEKLDLEDFKRRKEIHEAKQLKEDIPAAEAQMAINSMVSNMIQNKWQAIDLINGNIAAMQQYNRPDVIAVLSDMLADNYMHIGQLEKLLEIADSGAANIEAGKGNIEDAIEATDNLDEIEVDVEPIEDEVEEAYYYEPKVLDISKEDAEVELSKMRGDEYAHGRSIDRPRMWDLENTIKNKEDESLEELPDDDIPEELVLRTDFKKKGAAK